MKKNIMMVASLGAALAASLTAATPAGASGVGPNYVHYVKAHDAASCKSLGKSLGDTVAKQQVVSNTGAGPVTSSTRYVTMFDNGCAMASDGSYYAGVGYVSMKGSQEIPLFAGDVDVVNIKNPPQFITYEHGPYEFATKADCINHLSWFLDQLNKSPGTHFTATSTSDPGQCQNYGGFKYDVSYDVTSTTAPVFTSDRKYVQDVSGMGVFN